MNQKMKKFPCHNLELKNMPEEQWKDIIGFEGYYQVSNMGRIKSLSREREVYFPSRQSTVRFFIKERILKQSIVSSYNSLFPDQPKYLCRITLTLPVKQVSFWMVSRLVYSTFKNEKLALFENVILHKNGIGIDNRLSNLIPATYSEEHKRTYAQGRKISHFSVMSEVKRKEYTAKAANANVKKVAKYNLDGKRIKIYPSIKAAAEDTGINPTTISNSLYGLLLTAGGFIWRMTEITRVIDVSYYHQSVKHRISRLYQPVGKYSISGNKLLATYESLQQAAMAHGHTNTRQISDALNGRAKTAYGFLWKKVKK